ncbi:MAG: NUDIX domain-containing protein [Clostridia bacterium]|jgi:ADP-ribose pyrophosphatase YjhB (NUDIX family)|nr:NUDIX domain-containing protein [Clostridia bacterium]
MYYRNVFTVAAKAVIIGRENKMLLLHRSKEEMAKTHPSQSSVWDLPGGSVKFSETVLEGLLREVKEETNLNVNVLTPFSVYDSIRERHHVTIINYLCTYKSGKVLVSREHSYYKWVSRNDMIDLGVPAWLIRTYEKALMLKDQVDKNN